MQAQVNHETARSIFSSMAPNAWSSSQWIFLLLCKFFSFVWSLIIIRSFEWRECWNSNNRNFQRFQILWKNRNHNWVDELMVISNLVWCMLNIFCEGSFSEITLIAMCKCFVLFILNSQSGGWNYSVFPLFQHSVIIIIVFIIIFTVTPSHHQSNIWMFVIIVWNLLRR